MKLVTMIPAILLVSITFLGAWSVPFAHADAPTPSALYEYRNFTITEDATCIEVRGLAPGSIPSGSAWYQTVSVFQWDHPLAVDGNPYPWGYVTNWGSRDPAGSYHNEVSAAGIEILYEESGYNESRGRLNGIEGSDEQGRAVVLWYPDADKYFRGDFGGLFADANGVLESSATAYQRCALDDFGLHRYGPVNITITGTSNGSSIQFLRPVDFHGGVNVQDPTRAVILESSATRHIENRLFGVFSHTYRAFNPGASYGVLSWRGPGVVGTSAASCFDQCELQHVEKGTNAFISGPAGDWTFTAHASVASGPSSLYALLIDVQLPST